MHAGNVIQLAIQSTMILFMGKNTIIYIDKKTYSLEIACSSQQTLVDVLDSMYKYGLYICPSYITSHRETSINGNPLVTTQNILWGGESSL